MSLTRRQRQIAEALERDPDLSYADIGRELGISTGTVRNYVHRMAENAPNPYHLTPKALVMLLVRQRAEERAKAS